MADLNALVEEKINSDSDFQATLADLSDEDKEVAIAEKRTELLNLEFTSLSEKAAKAEELAKNQKIRAEKAEQEARKNKPAGESETSKTSEPLSLKDIRALQDVHDDNVDRLVSYAKFLGVDIATAKKTPEMQSYLRTEEEFRATEAAKNAGRGSRGTAKTTDAELVEQAASGQLPDDDEGIKRLAEARQAEKLAKLQK